MPWAKATRYTWSHAVSCTHPFVPPAGMHGDIELKTATERLSIFLWCHPAPALWVRHCATLGECLPGALFLY